jgi:glycosyltransferase involved in cell wall biosynthesis
MKILILAPYPPGIAPSQRFRFEQYLHFLAAAGISYEYVPFIDLATWQILHKPGHFGLKIWGVLKAFARRARLIFGKPDHDLVFIHREASHIGPPVFEWYLAKVLKKKIIYDFDDAIWLPNYSEHNRFFHRLKQYGKVRKIISWSWKVSAGNAYLADFAHTYNPKVQVNPTTIDTGAYHNSLKNHQEGKLTIGWTGTLTTIKYLHSLLPVIEKLEQHHAFDFVVIANEDPGFPLRSFRFVKWKKETEIEDLLQFHIGLMPLEDDIWAKGKCGFKALQYMSLGIPAVVSPVGVNAEIVDHEANGFVCQEAEEWFNAIDTLLKNQTLRASMGKAARQKIEKAYSVEANASNFLSFFR